MPRPPLRALGRAATALLLFASLGGFAQAQGPSGIPPAQPVPVSLPLAPIADKPIDLPTGGCPCVSGDGGTQFGIDLLLGQFLGFRGQAAVIRTPEGAFVVEAFYGAILDKLSSGEGAGGGGRYYFHRTDRSGNNSVLIGPGLGAYYHIQDKVWMAAPTVDFAWVHSISDNGAFELGLNAGLGIGLSDRQRYYYDQRSEVGKITPLFSLFTGFRF
jgi:hypothetical protein